MSGTHGGRLFGFASTAHDVLEGMDLSGTRAIVTGGASGIGLATVQALAGAGAEVTIATRNPTAAQAVAAQVARQTGSDVRGASLDLASPESVAAFVDSWTGPLQLLICNAGVMAIPERRLTAAGWEM